MIRAVVDTNVLVSGLLGSRVNRRVIEAFRDQEFLLVTSPLLIDVAVAGRASVLVTGDQDLLILNPFRRVSILTPAQFLQRLRK